MVANNSLVQTNMRIQVHFGFAEILVDPVRRTGQMHFLT